MQFLLISLITCAITRCRNWSKGNILNLKTMLKSSNPTGVSYEWGGAYNQSLCKNHRLAAQQMPEGGSNARDPILETEIRFLIGLCSLFCSFGEHLSILGNCQNWELKKFKRAPALASKKNCRSRESSLFSCQALSILWAYVILKDRNTA